MEVELTAEQHKYCEVQAERIEFGPQSNHARIRHNALMVCIDVFKEGLRQGKPKEGAP